MKNYIKTKIDLTKSQSFFCGILYVITLTLIGYQFINQSKAYFSDILKPNTVIKEVVKTADEEMKVIDDIILGATRRKNLLNKQLTQDYAPQKNPKAKPRN